MLYSCAWGSGDPRRYVVRIYGAGVHQGEGIEQSTSFVVGAARTRPAERLLPHHGAGGLVVDVKVPGGVPERGLRLLDRAAVLGEDRAGERIGGRLVDEA